MSSRIGNFTKQCQCLLAVLAVLMFLAGTVWAQTTASMKGTVKDTSGAIVPDASVTVKNIETGMTRTANTDANGSYHVVALPVGPYEVSAEKPGFKQTVRRGLNLVVGQEVALDLALEVGAVEQQVTVTAEAPLVNTTLSPTSGLIAEQQVKDLPLNGRSFDQLLTLNVGTVNNTANASRNSFSVSGRRPDENNFLLNGIEWLGVSNGLHAAPYGASGQVLGVEAVREFNTLTDTYGAEYGKRSGGQINIVTSSGTNKLHGSAFEYLRNKVVDARSFFDPPKLPAFKRNQFGGALGGPVKRDKLFLFGAYEGFRQRLGGNGQAAVVPDDNARRGLLPIGPNNTLIEVPNLKPAMLGYMALWREPNGGSIGGGAGLAFYDGLNAIQEDNGQMRLDYTISANDSLSGIYMIDDGSTDSISSAFNNESISQLQAKVVSLQETRIFSPNLLNVARVGYTRAYSFTAGHPTVPIPANLLFVQGANVGTITIGGSLIAGGSTFARATGGGGKYFGAKNLFTFADDVHYNKGSHAFTFGGWFQRNQVNPGSPPTAGDGAVSYASLTTMLQDIPTAFNAVANIAVMGYRQSLAAWYVQDEIKLRTNLSMRVGLRHEMTNGFNEKSCRAANYGYDNNGTINSEPFVGCSALTQNNAKKLFQPRVGVSWDPTGTGTWSVRAGFSIIHDIQDDLSHRLWNVPLNGVLTRPAAVPMLSYIPIPRGTLATPQCTVDRIARSLPCEVYSPGGFDPNFKTPTIQQWTLTIERQLSTNIMLRVGYVGSEDFHMPINVNMNQPRTQVCANPSGCVSGGAGAVRGVAPQGKEYIPPPALPISATNSGLDNPYVGATYSWFYGGTSSYHALDVSLVKRITSGFSFRANYTFSKSLDITSAIALTLNSNAQQVISNRYNVGLSHGISSFSLQHQFNSNFSYELPFGAGKTFARDASGVWDKIISGWQWNGIVQVQSGFPFSPLVGRNISGTGDTRNSDAADKNPNYKGSLTSGVTAGCPGVAAGQKLGTPNLFFDPCAFALPIAGTFGNAGRGTIVGPGLFDIDTSFFKKIPLTERYNLQFRAEAFNVFNHPNFGSPQNILFSGNSVSSAAAHITSTNTKGRILQFALRLTF